MLRIADLPLAPVNALLQRYGLSLVVEPDGQPIPASFWGDSEAGIAGRQVFVRADTPVHSVLHESCHTICMSEERRTGLDRDAGGDDIEEAAVCYLQILLADEIAAVGRKRLMQDMDAWGYSFRLGSAARWFAEDAADAAEWLVQHGLITECGTPTFKLRGSV